VYTPGGGVSRGRVCDVARSLERVLVELRKMSIRGDSRRYEGGRVSGFGEEEWGVLRLSGGELKCLCRCSQAVLART